MITIDKNEELFEIIDKDIAKFMETFYPEGSVFNDGSSSRKRLEDSFPKYHLSMQLMKEVLEKIADSRFGEKSLRDEFVKNLLKLHNKNFNFAKKQTYIELGLYSIFNIINTDSKYLAIAVHETIKEIVKTNVILIKEKKGTHNGYFTRLLKVGDIVQFENCNDIYFGQDFTIKTFVPHNILFRVSDILTEKSQITGEIKYKYQLVAPGYGTAGNYGCGAIYVYIIEE